MIISIDFSITSTGICILDNENNVHFGSFPYKDILKKYIITTIDELGIYCNIRERNEDKKDLSTQSRFHTKEAIILGNEILNFIKSINGYNDKKNILIFEGFSYASEGNRLAQISGYQFITRHILMPEIASFEDLYIYTPQSVKAAANAAKRGMGKEAMIESFINHENTLVGLENNVLYKNIINNPDIFKNKPSNRTKNIIFQKPIDDMIDSYWLLITYLNKENIKLYN